MVKKKYSLKQAKVYAKDFVDYLEHQKKIQVKAAYLFGSYSQGKQREWSDLDVAVISSEFKNGGSFVYLGSYRRAVDLDRLISPIGFDIKDFQSSSHPLVPEIKKGIKL